MFEINEIVCYETQDGEVFKTYEEAEEHNKLLIEKETPFDELQLRIFNKDGELLPSSSIYEYDNVWFVYAKTGNGAKYLERFIGEHTSSLEEDIEIEPKTLYRYDYDEERWISQEEDLNRFNSYWANLITFEEARC